ncbi:MAG: YbhB/YbcL family Raf kinase inhibitor-like protein [Acidimicrobiales bacterium]
MRSRTIPLIVAVLAAGASLVACSSSDGRSLPAPNPRNTTTSVSSPVVGQPSDGDTAAAGFALTSTAFIDGAVIPARYTCAGESVSPPLSWTSAPPAAALAIVVRDRNAVGFVHWVVTGIDPTVQGVGDGGIPEGAVEGANSNGTIGWTPPCPPAGSGTHTYDVVLHALAQPVTLDPGLAAGEAARRIEAASSAQARLSGTATG